MIFSMEFNKPSEFDVNVDNLSESFKRFRTEVEVYFVATETEKKSREVQVARLKNLLGSEGLKLYSTITTLKPGVETVNSVLDVLEKHCTPRKNETMVIYKFFSRNQAANEPFERYFTDLKSLVAPCEFGEQEQKLLKSQIILGLYDKSTQERLLREDPSLEKTVSFCKTVEMAELNMKILKAHPVKTTIDNPTEILEVNRKPQMKRPPEHQDPQDSLYACDRCGFKHAKGRCPAFGKQCSSCKKYNHFAKKMHRK